MHSSEVRHSHYKWQESEPQQSEHHVGEWNRITGCLVTLEELHVSSMRGFLHL